MESSYTELSEQIGEWSARNFDYGAPQLGVAEELGELLHLILKKRQGIRPVPDYDAEVKDALADAGVYLLDWFARYSNESEILPCNEMTEYGPQDSLDYILGDTICSAGHLIIQTNVHKSSNAPDTFIAMELLAQLECLAKRFGFELKAQICATWEEVSKRDWRKFPQNGLTE